MARTSSEVVVGPHSSSRGFPARAWVRFHALLYEITTSDTNNVTAAARSVARQPISKINTPAITTASNIIPRPTELATLSVIPRNELDVVALIAVCAVLIATKPSTTAATIQNRPS